MAREKFAIAGCAFCLWQTPRDLVNGNFTRTQVSPLGTRGILSLRAAKAGTFDNLYITPGKTGLFCACLSESVEFVDIVDRGKGLWAAALENRAVQQMTVFLTVVFM